MLKRSLAIGLSVALPLTLVGLAAWGLQRDVDPEGYVAEFDGRLERNDPQVLVVGSSVARRDVRPRVLAEQLGLRKNQAIMLTLPNSVGAHWYAMLKHRVFEAGYRPKLVLVVNALGTMVTNEIPTEANLLRLVEQMEPTDTEIVERVDGLDGNLGWRYARAEAAETRQSFLHTIRDAATAVVLGGRMDRAEKFNDSIARKVFADDLMDYGRYTNGDAFMVHLDDHYDQWSEEADPDSSFIPDIVGLCREYGAKVVFVRVPFPPSNAEKDKVGQEVERKSVEMIAEAGAGYLDFRSLGFTDDQFDDMAHMNVQGAEIFTAELGERLVAMNALGERAKLVVDGRVFPDKVTGDPQRIEPGSSVRFAFDRGWPYDATDFQILAYGRYTGDVPPIWTVAGTSGEFRLDDGLASTVMEGLAPSEAWSIELSVPPDGSPLELMELAVGSPPITSFPVGDAEALNGASVRLIGGPAEQLGLVPEFDSPPVEFFSQVAVRAGQRGMGVIALPEYIGLSDAQTVGDELPMACSPIRVYEDGQPLPLPHMQCDEVPARRRGAYCHARGSIFLTASDGSKSWNNGRSYQLALDPDRGCKRFRKGGGPLRDVRWLYPQDTVRFTVPGERFKTFQRGIESIAVQVVPRYRAQNVDIDVKIFADGELAFSGQEKAMEMVEVSKVFEFARIDRDVNEVVVEITNSSPLGFVLLGRATLNEQPVAAFPEREDIELVEVEVQGGDAWLANAFFVDGQPELEINKRRDHANTHAFEVQSFWSTSTTYLRKQGLPNLSPMSVSIDGQAVELETSMKNYEAGCQPCAVHWGKVVRARGNGIAELALVDGPTVTRGQDQGTWVYPGSATRWVLPNVQGPYEVRMTGRVLGKGSQSWTFEAGSHIGSLELSEDVLVGTVRGEGSGELPITLRADKTTPFVLVQRLEIVVDGVAHDVVPPVRDVPIPGQRD